MKRLQTMFAAALAIGCLTLPAAAQTGSAGGVQAIYQDNVAMSRWNVWLTQQSEGASIWNVAVSFHSTVQTPPPPHIEEVEFEFFDVGADVVNLGGASALELDAFGSSGGTNINWREIDGFDRLTYNYRVNSSTYADMITPTSIFSGTINVASSNTIRAIKVGLRDGGGSTAVYHVRYSTVPEPASLAMLLPGIVPLGLVLRRRRAAARS